MLTCVIVGMLIMFESCNTVKGVSSSDITHTETLESDTSYHSRVVPFLFKGDSAKASSDSIVVRVLVKDSINVRDSIVYRYRYVNVPGSASEVDILPVYAISPYGYARAHVDNNKLWLEMKINERVISAKVDSAVAVVTNTKTIVNTEIRKEVKVKKRSWPFFVMMLVMIAGAALAVFLIIKNWTKLTGL